MAKIMLVEDDTNLSEIYQARLTAEGYEIVSAHDGEEALALAAKEKPELIISDVMMPKISGFEMLDILRNTEGLKETKVIMLTALGQADDKTRAEGLGADRYLVKSQVTLEDIVKAAQELLTGTSAPAAPAPTTADAIAAPVPTPVAAPVAPAPTPMAVAAPPVATPMPPVSTPMAPEPAPAVPVATPPPVAPIPVAPTAPTPAPVAPVAAAPVAPVPPVTATEIPVPTPQPLSTPAPVPIPVAPTAPTPAPVAPVAAAPVAPVDPVPVQPTAPSDPTAAADNQLVANAVEDLMEGVGEKTAPTPPPVPDPTAAAPPTPTDPADTLSAPTESADNAATGASGVADSSSNDNVGIAHKKVIRPITDGPEQAKPSLETLLADEERKNPGSTNVPAPSSDQPASAPVTEVPHQPGHIITPSAAESMNNGSGIDPNSIAL